MIFVLIGVELSCWIDVKTFPRRHTHGIVSLSYSKKKRGRGVLVIDVSPESCASREGKRSWVVWWVWHLIDVVDVDQTASTTHFAFGVLSSP